MTTRPTRKRASTLDPRPTAVKSASTFVVPTEEERAKIAARAASAALVRASLVARGIITPRPERPRLRYTLADDAAAYLALDDAGHVSAAKSVARILDDQSHMPRWRPEEVNQ